MGNCTPGLFWFKLAGDDELKLLLFAIQRLVFVLYCIGISIGVAS